MKLLVTGAAGFIGSHFCKLAREQGHKVMGLDAMTYAGSTSNLAFADLTSFVHGNICNPLTVRVALEGFQPDAVIHFAAETHVGRSLEDREVFLRTNVLGTDVLLFETMQYWPQHNPRFRFVHVSTDEVYGSLRANEKRWTEDSPYAPTNPYAASKAASDHLAMSYWRTWKLPVILTHSTNNYGPRQHPEKLMPILIHCCLADKPIPLHGDGHNIRDWLHVEDHCKGLMLALLHGEPGGTYNFSANCERTNIDMAKLVHNVCYPEHPTREPKLTFVPDREGNDRRYGVNPAHARLELGWHHGASIENRLPSIVDWYLQNPDYMNDYASN